MTILTKLSDAIRRVVNKLFGARSETAGSSSEDESSSASSVAATRHQALGIERLVRLARRLHQRGKPTEAEAIVETLKDGIAQVPLRCSGRRAKRLTRWLDAAG